MQIEMGYQIQKILGIGQFSVLKFDVQYGFSSLLLYRDGIEPETCLRMSPLKWDISQPSKMVIDREFMYESQWYQISKYQIAHYFKYLKSDTPYCFAYISLSWYRTEMFLYSRESYGSNLSNEICASILSCFQSEKLRKKCGSFQTIEEIKWCL